jgi:type VII secretion protein EccB
MPLNYTSLEQVSGWRFLRHRLSVAIARHSARLVHDPSRNATASLLVGAVASVLVIGVCFVIAFFKPNGQIGQASIVADRASGALYVEVDGVMHPALNLASARLIADKPANPRMVPMTEIAKLPIGPMVGIAGAPDDLAVRTPDQTGWGLCDRLGSTGAKVIPKVTVLAGMPELGDWAHEVVSPQSALMSYGDAVYVVTDGHRSQIDLTDKPVTLALGIQAGAVHPAPMSRALYEALIPTAPLRVPDVPEPGGPVGYATPQLPLVSGSVLTVVDVSGGRSFFVALPAGVQMVPETVAVMLTNADVSRQGRVFGADAAAIARLPQAVGFEVSMYPAGRVQLLDKAAEPVTCVMWKKGSGEPQATVTTVSGRRLPLAVDDEQRVMPLVSGAGRGAADQVYISRQAANFIQVTGVEPNSVRTESLWWISNSGVRYGIETQGDDESRTRKALGLGQAAPVPAPWAVIRWLPAGPTLSHAAAMTQHDTVTSDSVATRLNIQGAQR